jgi:enoyl-CoA hydratase/carnithine racemase
MSDLLMKRHANGRVAEIQLNRPQSLNAFTTQMMQDLTAHLNELAQEDGLRALVLSGAGDRAFCTGADLKERDGMTDEQWFAQHGIFQEAFRHLREFKMPTIASVDGFALAGGCELALTCDFIVASERASFGFPEVTRGIIPGVGGTQLLPRLVGRARAKQLLFTGRRWSGQEAVDWGMAVELTQAGEASTVALEMAGAMAANGPVAVRQAKRAVDLGADIELHTAIALAVECYNITVTTEDRREGVRAFAEKRPPDFQGR